MKKLLFLLLANFVFAQPGSTLVTKRQLDAELLKLWYVDSIALQGSQVNYLDVTNIDAKQIYLFVKAAQGGNDIDSIRGGKANQKLYIHSHYNNQDAITITKNGNILLPNFVDKYTLSNNEGIELFFDAALGKYKVMQGVRDEYIVNLLRQEQTNNTSYLNGRISSEIGSVTQFVDGWYANNISGNDEGFMLRGIGHMGDAYRVLGTRYVGGIGISLAPTERISSGEISVTIYVNGKQTPYTVTLNSTNNMANLLKIGIKALKLYSYDYLQLKYKCYDVVGTYKLDAIVYFNYIDEPKSLDSGYTITAHAVNDGIILVEPQKPYYEYGEEVKVTARANSGWKFWGWNGDFKDNNPFDTTITFLMTDDVKLTARFRKNVPTQYRILIAELTTDTTHAIAVKNAFMQGYDRLSGNLTTDSVKIYHPQYSYEDAYKYADSVGAEIIVISRKVINQIKDLTEKYYPILTFTPPGENISKQLINTNGDLYTAILTGAGWSTHVDSGNRTAYDVEMWADDPTTTYPTQPLASLSNGYAAGLFVAFTENYFNIEGYDYPATRHFWKYNLTEDNQLYLKTWTAKNGYGYFSLESFDAVYSMYYYNVIYTANDNNYFRRYDPFRRKK